MRWLRQRGPRRVPRLTGAVDAHRQERRRAHNLTGGPGVRGEATVSGGSYRGIPAPRIGQDEFTEAGGSYIVVPLMGGKCSAQYSPSCTPLRLQGERSQVWLCFLFFFFCCLNQAAAPARGQKTDGAPKTFLAIAACLMAFNGLVKMSATIPWVWTW